RRLSGTARADDDGGCPARRGGGAGVVRRPARRGRRPAADADAARDRRAPASTAGMAAGLGVHPPSGRSPPPPRLDLVAPPRRPPAHSARTLITLSMFVVALPGVGTRQSHHKHA